MIMLRYFGNRIFIICVSQLICQDRDRSERENMKTFAAKQGSLRHTLHSGLAFILVGSVPSALGNGYGS